MALFRSYRLFNFAGFALCVTSMLVALFYFERYLKLEPCPLCWFQRYGMVGAAVVFLLAALAGPRGAVWRWLLSLGVLITAGFGAFIAGRHTWLQSIPEDQRPSCGPTIEYLREMLPFKEFVQTVIRGDGNCAKVDWSLFGLGIPAWTLVVFVVLILMALVAPFVGRRPS